MSTFYSKVVSIRRESFCNATPWVSACSVDLTQTCWVSSLLNYQRGHGLSLQDPTLWALLLVLCESTGIDRSHSKISRFVWSHSLHFFTFSINSRRASISTMLLKLLLSRSLLVSVLQNPKITSLNSPYLVTLQCVHVADCFVFLNALSCLGFHDTADSAFFSSSLTPLSWLSVLAPSRLYLNVRVPHSWDLGTCSSLFALSQN